MPTCSATSATRGSATSPCRTMLSEALTQSRVPQLIDPAQRAVRRPADAVRIDCRQAGQRNDLPHRRSIETGMIVSFIQSNYSVVRVGARRARHGFALQNRGALFTLAPGPAQHARRATSARCTRSSPAFMQKGDVRIGFGIMGGWNQAQAHAQFVSDIADFGLNIQEALEAGRFTKQTFAGCDVQIEALVPEATREALATLGHQITVVPPRSTDAFGFGQAVMSNGESVHFGASDPRHDGAAIPEGVPLPLSGQRK